MRSFTNVIKPTHICNLACTYCYNDDVRDPIMREGTLMRTLEQTASYAEQSKAEIVHYIWHGGEPMVPGLKWYENMVQMQQTLCADVPYRNYIQTNGVLINQKWIDFFKRNDFSVSISIDGPARLNDVYRKTHQGKGSFDRVFRAIEQVQEAGLPVGICMVLSKATINHVEEILDFLVKHRLPFEPIPVVKSGGARETYLDLGLDQYEYGEAWKKLYDLWMALPEDKYVYCDDFVAKTKGIIHGHGASCFGMANCSTNNISTDPVGDVFACSTLSGSDEICYGNLVIDDLDQIMCQKIAQEFLNRKTDPHCTTCKWQHVCHGGCPARSYKFHDDINIRDYYCPSLYNIYEHIEEKLGTMGVGAAAPHPLHMSDGIEAEPVDA